MKKVTRQIFAGLFAALISVMVPADCNSAAPQKRVVKTPDERKRIATARSTQRGRKHPRKSGKSPSKLAQSQRLKHWGSSRRAPEILRTVVVRRYAGSAISLSNTTGRSTSPTVASQLPQEMRLPDMLLSGYSDLSVTDTWSEQQGDSTHVFAKLENVGNEDFTTPGYTHWLKLYKNGEFIAQTAFDSVQLDESIILEVKVASDPNAELGVAPEFRGVVEFDNSCVRKGMRKDLDMDSSNNSFVR